MNHDELEGRGCERVRGRLDRLLDGGLTELEAALDRGHLEACAGCRRERERWRDVHAAVRDAAAVDAVERSPELAFALEGLDARLDAAAAGARRRRFRRVAGGALASFGTAAAALVLLVGLVAGGLAPSTAVDPIEALVPDVEIRFPDWTGLLDLGVDEG